MQNENTYQSILQQLSNVPIEYLPQIDIYLHNLTHKIKKEGKSKSKIMDFAGAWSDFSKEEFQDFLNATQENRSNLFNRNVNL